MIAVHLENLRSLKKSQENLKKTHIKFTKNQKNKKNYDIKNVTQLYRKIELHKYWLNKGKGS